MTETNFPLFHIVMADFMALPKKLLELIARCTHQERMRKKPAPKHNHNQGEMFSVNYLYVHTLPLRSS